MATEPMPAAVSVCEPRVSASAAVRDPATPGDHSRTSAGFPFSAASDRVAPPGAGSWKSGAGKDSYIHVVRGAAAGPGIEVAVIVFAPELARGFNGSVSRVPPSTRRTREFSGTSVNTCVAPDGQLTVIFTTRWLA